MKKRILLSLILTTCFTSLWGQTSEFYPGNYPGDNLETKPFFTSEVTTENYLVVSGVAKHFSPAPKIIQHWNENNYGLGYQRSFKEKDSLYRYSLEGGVFKESFGKTATYFAAGAFRDILSEPRISVGVMIGAAYRVNSVYDGYYFQGKAVPLNPHHTPVRMYTSKEITPMGGLMAQFEIPYTPAVIQTTFLPKIAGNSSAVLFSQLLIKF